LTLLREKATSHAMSEQQLPHYYDDLDATREQALALLVRGVKDRRSGMHTFTVATIGADGTPRLRTVVNRGFDIATRALRFHTDARSPKLQELVDDPRAAIHVYDQRAKTQLRMEALATIHRDDDLRQSAWEKTRDFSRECYRVVRAPGDAVESPSDVTFTDGHHPDEGEENFMAVTLRIHTLEWLYLAHQGHRRAKFSWDQAGGLTQTWLVP
jgi:pyridoxamine 5'-phosphate oxidase